MRAASCLNRIETRYRSSAALAIALIALLLGAPAHADNGFSLPSKTIREMITGSVDVIVQASRLRDGSRRITHITEVLGMEGDVVTLQNIIVYDVTGEDANGKLIGRHRSTGIARPRFWDRAAYYGEEGRLATALAAAEVRDIDGSPLGEKNA